MVKLSDINSVPAVLARLTLEEKASLVSGGGIYTSQAIERLGIPSALFIDAGCGVNLRQYLEALYNLGIIKDEAKEENNGTEGIGTMARFGHIASNILSRENLSEADNALLDACLNHIQEQISEKAYPSCFPSNSLLAATWNREAVYKNAAAVGKEASAYGVDVLLGTPCINIQRDPKGGRNFENYSEDPYLTGELSAEFVKAIQEQGIVGNAKHFAANNQETDRMFIDEMIPERALYEIYFPAFKKCVEEGRAGSIMSAYNWINGTPCAHHKWMLTDVLRREWNYEGFVVSDWRAAYNLVEAVKAGNDLAMPGPRDKQEIIDAVNEGRLSVEELDKAVGNFLKGLTKMQAVRGRKYHTIDWEASARTAYETAAEGITLLKNKDETLPLKKDKKVAVFGERAGQFIESGVGSGHVFTDKTSSLISCVAEIVGKENVTVDALAEDTQAAIIVVSTEGQEGGDCTSMSLKNKDLKLLSEVIHMTKPRGIKVILVMNIASPVEMEDFIDELDGCLDVYFPGQEGARAAADILFGRINPSGKLPHTFPRYYHDVPSYGNFPGYDRKVYYGEGIYVGYRWYDSRKIEPMFPFGYGLSYTTFKISDMRLDKQVFNIHKNDVLTIKVTVTNTGERAGKEVVQLYIKDVASTLDRPEKELKGFEKVYLEPGESKEAVFTVTKEDLSVFDVKFHKWICEPGNFEILAGNSSGNIMQTARFRADGFNLYGYHAQTPITRISLDQRAADAILETLHGYISEKEFYNMAYFGQRHNLETVWNTMMSKYVPEGRREGLYREILEKLEKIDASEAKLVEKYTF
ncbi:MAG: glycoside hydrolase family 3 N-terminal domain-containing protein [Eubacteriales bacterium]|nr:glycoside hydrolase family 3 N-terminal domain-containing protein [Eubacteriales bacterium]